MASPLWNRAKAVVSRSPIFIAPEATLRTVTRVLWSEAVGLLLVGQADGIVGIVSERDVVAAVARGADPDTTTAEAVMTGDVISLRPRDSLYDVAVEMLDEGIRHIPLADEWGEVTGVVSIRDLLRPLLVDSLGG